MTPQDPSLSSDYVHATSIEPVQGGLKLVTLPDGFKYYAHSYVPETEFMYNEIYVKQEYLRHGLSLDDAACVFDIGANIGLFTLFVKARNPRAIVHAFEPIPETCDVLRRNVELHHLTDVYIHNIGLGSQVAAQQTFTYYPNMAGSSTATPAIKKAQREQMERDAGEAGKANVDFLLATEPRTAPVQTISSFLDEHDIPMIDFVKMDVEGSELAILQGIAEKHIPRIRQFAMETHTPQLTQEVRALLTRMGFKVVSDPGMAGKYGIGVSEVHAIRAG